MWGLKPPIFQLLTTELNPKGIMELDSGFANSPVFAGHLYLLYSHCSKWAEIIPAIAQPFSPQRHISFLSFFSLIHFHIFIISSSLVFIFVVNLFKYPFLSYLFIFIIFISFFVIFLYFYFIYFDHLDFIFCVPIFISFILSSSHLIHFNPTFFYLVLISSYLLSIEFFNECVFSLFFRHGHFVASTSLLGFLAELEKKVTDVVRLVTASGSFYDPSIVAALSPSPSTSAHLGTILDLLRCLVLHSMSPSAVPALASFALDWAKEVFVCYDNEFASRTAHLDVRWVFRLFLPTVTCSFFVFCWLF